MTDLPVGLVPLEILDELLDRRQAQDDREGHDGHEPPRRRDVGDLLEEADAEEEDVGVPPKLLEEELGQEREEVVLGRRDPVRDEALPLRLVDEDPPDVRYPGCCGGFRRVERRIWPGALVGVAIVHVAAAGALEVGHGRVSLVEP